MVVGHDCQAFIWPMRLLALVSWAVASLRDRRITPLLFDIAAKRLVMGSVPQEILLWVSQNWGTQKTSLTPLIHQFLLMIDHAKANFRKVGRECHLILRVVYTQMHSDAFDVFFGRECRSASCIEGVDSSLFICCLV